jgi:2-amino-4-hydroxy-6-hydroxymethyldihydropteridine diphosphokinase
MKPLRKVVFSLGSNLGDRLANLQGAVDAIRDTPDVIVVDVSSVYETAPVDLSEDSPEAQAIEDAFGRKRSEEKKSRTLDVDLVMVGTTETEQPDLTLPHPRAHQRGFVLVPWSEIDPAAELPGRGPIAPLLEAVGAAGVTRRDDLVIEGD